MSGQVGRHPDIIISQSGSGTTINVGSATWDPVPTPLRDAKTIHAQVNAFIKKIESVRPNVLEPSEAAASTFISESRKAAWTCFGRCVNMTYAKQGNLIGEIQQELIRVAQAGELPYVEIVVKDDLYFPWEWLATPTPSDTPSSVDHGQNKVELIAAMHDILGFAAITRRILLESMPTDAPVNQRLVPSKNNKLQLRYVRHLALAGASTQQTYFNGHDDVIDLVGPVPDAKPELPLALGVQLLNPGAAYFSKGQPPGGLDQVVHIHCHHGTTGQDVLYRDDVWATSELVLRERPTKIEVTLDELEGELNDPDLSTRFGDVDRPLVFLNACNGDFHPLSTESFSRLFTLNGNRGVISTSIRVPDQVAACFARFFYDSLFFDPGTTVGAALHEAKVKLLTRRSNPLGLLYTYVGDPDLVIVPPLSSIVEAPMPI